MVMLRERETSVYLRPLWFKYGIAVLRGEREMAFRYSIAGNFHMVQIFVVFADRSAIVKIRTTEF